jgi:hypothetical protein
MPKIYKRKILTDKNIEHIKEIESKYLGVVSVGVVEDKAIATFTSALKVEGGLMYRFSESAENLYDLERKIKRKMKKISVVENSNG